MKMKYLLVLSAFALLASIGFAADAVTATPIPPAATTDVTPVPGLDASFLTWLPAILTPLAIAGVKKVMPSIPSWTVPTLLVPILGMAITFLSGYVTGHTLPWYAGIGLGAVGLFLREVKDQLVPASNGGWTPTTLLPPS